MSEHQTPTLTSLHRLVIATVVLYMMLAGLILYVWADATARRARVEEIATATNSALCTFRADLQVRFDQGTQFLEDHPEGLGDIPPELIQQNLDNQSRTLNALGSLVCTPSTTGKESP